MFTIKQLEAVYWVSALGSFEAAAAYLNMAQSTISKRIGELEENFATPLFHRTRRKPVLTTKGEEVIQIAEQMLRLNDQLGTLAKQSAVPTFRFRLGVTDLVALSWMPALLAGIMERYPLIALEPEIDLTASLLERLADRRLDFVICPRVPQQPQFVSTRLGEIELAWMGSPRLLPNGGSVGVAKLVQYPLLMQSSGSILRPILHRVIENPSLAFKKKILCNNMAALAHLAAHGLGITVLPKAFFMNYVNDGRLTILTTDVELPALEYFATYRTDYHAAFSQDIVALCLAKCDFHSQIRSGSL